MVKGILGIQICGLLFSLIMIYLSFLHYKRKEFKAEVFFFWLLLWMGFIFMVVFPTSLDVLIKDVLKFGRRLDFFVVLGFIFMISLMYYNYIMVNKTKTKVEKIIRKIAMENMRNKGKERKK